MRGEAFGPRRVRSPLFHPGGLDGSELAMVDGRRPALGPRRQCERTRQIASGLVIRERTVEVHVPNLLAKFSLVSRREVVASALRQRIVDVQDDE